MHHSWIMRLQHIVLCTVVLGQERKESSENKTKEIWLLGLFPFSGPWPGGLGQLPAVEMGLRDVNADPTILPGYKLYMTVNDTSVRNYSFY